MLKLHCCTKQEENLQDRFSSIMSYSTLSDIDREEHRTPLDDWDEDEYP